MENYPKVLLLDGNPDGAQLEEILKRCAAITRVGSMPEALALAKRGVYDALFCSWELAAGTWRNVLERVRKERLEIPVIVFCHCGGEQEWNEVLKAGGFDLVAPPYDDAALDTLLRHARACRERQLQYAMSA
jgi:DNA-binding NtrC family response regulator